MVFYGRKSGMMIGIMGGTFNPPHNAHLACARKAAKACALERVLFLPANDPPHKPLAGEVSFATRCEMTRLAIAGNNDFELSTIEGERQGKSYSIDTLTSLQYRYPHDAFSFIIGSDSFLELGLWHRYAEFVKLCSLIVLERPGRKIACPHQSLPVAIRNEFSYSPDAHILLHRCGTQIYFVSSTPLDISSTAIRALAAAGKDISHLVPAGVADYITTQRIYTR